MKKVLTLTALLLAAAFFFTGCANGSGDSSGGGGGSGGLPGRWSTSANYYNASKEKIFADDKDNPTVFCGSVTRDGRGGAVYINEHPVETNSTNPLTPNTFRASSYLFMEDLDITGFEAVLSCTSSQSTYGLCFNIDYEWENFYEIILEQKGILIKKRIDGVDSIIQNWAIYDFIKAEPNENTVLVYKNGNSIVIKVNDNDVYTINNPEITRGSVGFNCAMSYDDIQNDRTIRTDYKLTKLQR